TPTRARPGKPPPPADRRACPISRPGFSRGSRDCASDRRGGPVCDDPTGSVPAAAAREFGDASREVLGMTTKELQHVRATIEDGRESRDAVVGKGADLYRTMARHVQT